MAAEIPTQATAFRGLTPSAQENGDGTRENHPQSFGGALSKDSNPRNLSIPIEAEESDKRPSIHSGQSRGNRPAARSSFVKGNAARYLACWQVKRRVRMVP